MMTKNIMDGLTGIRGLRIYGYPMITRHTGYVGRYPITPPCSSRKLQLASLRGWVTLMISNFHVLIGRRSAVFLLTKLNAELTRVRQSFAAIDDGNHSIEVNYLANAIFILSNADLLGLTSSEAQLAAAQEYRRWTTYYQDCKRVGFRTAHVPITANLWAG